MTIQKKRTVTSTMSEFSSHALSLISAELLALPNLLSQAQVFACYDHAFFHDTKHHIFDSWLSEFASMSAERNGKSN